MLARLDSKRLTNHISLLLKGALFLIIGLACAQDQRLQSSDVRQGSPTTTRAAPITLSVTTVSPAQLTQGSQTNLVLIGTGFSQGMKIDLGPGIKIVSPVQVIGDKQANLKVAVDPNATLGVRTIKASVQTLRVNGPATIAVAPAPVKVLQQQTEAPTKLDPDLPPPPLPSAPSRQLPQSPDGSPTLRTVTPTVIQSVQPNMLFRGQTYLLTIKGQNLSTNMQLDLGDGILSKGPLKLFNNTTATIQVSVKQDAIIGVRNVKLKSGASAWAIQTTTLSVNEKQQAPVVTAKAKVAIEPKLPPLNLKTIAIYKGKIELVSPNWWKYSYVGGSNEANSFKPTENTPVLHDDTVLTWKEQNPGLAERFEVRFYVKDKLIKTVSVEKPKGKLKSVLPTWYRPTGDVVAAVLAAVPAKKNLSTGKTNSKVMNASSGSGKNKTDLEIAHSLALAKADITWEVAGFHTYNQSGMTTIAQLEASPLQFAANQQGGQVVGDMKSGPVVADKQVEVEVEISERWPLRAPDKPTGFGCPIANNDLYVVNKEHTGVKKSDSETEVELAHHTNDEFELEGNIDLSNSPYAIHADTKKLSFFTKVAATSWSFENIFIDWGDGTVQPLTLTQSGDAGTYTNKESVVVSPGSTEKQVNTKVFSLDQSISKYQHKYTELGQKYVRVYQISSDDVQIGAQHVANYASGGQIYSLYFQAVSLGGAGSNAVPPEKLNIAKSVADRAYQLYCKEINIQPRHDPLSDGPLHLETIEVQGFPGAAAEESLSMQTIGMPQANAIVNTGAIINQNTSTQKQQGKAKTGSSELNALAIASTPVFASTADGSPKFTACDVSVTAGAKLSYYGKGQAKFRWMINGQQLLERVESVGPSDPRSDKTLDDIAKLSKGNAVEQLAAKLKAKQALITDTGPIPSGDIALDNVGKYEVMVSAEVIPTKNKLYQYAIQALGAYTGKTDPNAASLIIKGLKPTKKIGVLAPFTVATGSGKSVSYLDESLTQLASTAKPLVFAKLNLGGSVIMSDTMANLSGSVNIPGPPNYVISKPKPYQVVGHKKEEPCTFEFPVTGGSFLITGLQSPDTKTPQTTHVGNVFTGKGNLKIKLPGSSGELETRDIPLSFKDWVVKNDGVTVESGQISLPKVAIKDQQLPGMVGTITAINGKAGDKLDATMNLKVKNSQLVLTAAPLSVAQWTNLTSTLSPQGDWIYHNAPKMGETNIYHSTFTIEPDTVTLDLSATEGSGADKHCNGEAGEKWRGVHLGKAATVNVFNFDLPGKVTQMVSDWGIDSAGLCGAASVAKMDKALMEGFVHWDSVGMTASNSNFEAKYMGMWVEVPWLATKLKAAAEPVIENDGKVTLSLLSDAQPLTYKYNDITMRVDDLLFDSVGGIWAARSNTCFDFTGEGKSFAKDVCVNDLFFGMNGKAYFDKNGGSKTVDITGKSGNIALDTVDHKSVLVTAPAGPNERLRFNFTSQLNMSDALPKASTTVNYGITEQNNTYNAVGITMKIDPVTKKFPDGQPSVTVKIAPQYNASKGQTAYNDLIPGGNWLIPAAHAVAGNVRYYGNVDFGILGVDALAGVTGEFVLGDYEGSDYWATKVLKDLPGGVPVLPPIVTLYQVGGGLGYNVALNVCEGQSLQNVTPQIDKQTAFFAQGLFGSPDGFAYKLRGCLTVKVKEGARMDYDAWLLNKNNVNFNLSNMTSSSNKKGDFYGYFQYGGGSFDGTLNGQYSFLDNMAYVKAENDAIKLHFGSDAGYVHVGTKQNPVTGHVLIIDANAYAGVDLYPTPGFTVGASASKELVAGNCGNVCAKAGGHYIVDASITAAPKLSYSNSQGLSVDACIDGECFGASVSTDLEGSALPPYLYASTSFGSCPTPDVKLGLRVLPSPKPSVSFDWCGIF